MQLQWKQVPPTDALDAMTEYRLNHLAQSAPAGGDTTTWWSALVQLDHTDVAAFDTALTAQFGSDVFVAPEYLEGGAQYLEPDPDSTPDEGRVVTIYARASVLAALNSASNTLGVTGVELGSDFAPEALAMAAPEPQAASATTIVPPGSVTVAVIDDGIAFAHNLFRKGTCDSRVIGAFIMDSVKPNGVGVGRKLDKAEIDALLVANTYSGLLDEESFYRAAGSINRVRNFFSTATNRRAHGTHVMSLAAGFDMAEGREDRPIIAVQLPTRVTEDTSGSSMAPSLRSAIRYILKEARKIRIGSAGGKIAPLVVNFSYGNFAGPHDGTGVIAHLIDKELKSTPDQEIRVVLPASNGNLARAHAQVSFANAAPDARIALDLNVYPDDYTCSYVQFWMPYSADPTPPNFVNVRVTPPNSTQSILVSAIAGSKQELLNEAGEKVAQLGYEFVSKRTKRGVITLSLEPTFSHKNVTNLAPSGRWNIEVENVALASDQQVDVRIERDETLPGYPTFGRQAYFDNACYVRFDTFGYPLATDPMGSDCPVVRAGTLNGFATGKLPLVVGAFVQSDGLMSDYSAAGPITPKRGNTVANRIGPDASARADDSPVRLGVLGAGTRSGSMVRMNGTSVSAPLVARYVADGLAAGQTANRAWLWAAAAQSDGSFPAPKPEDTRTGGGRLRLPNPFEGPTTAPPTPQALV